MPSFPNLHRKGDLYYARFRIPRRLTAWLDQQELRWSLQTQSLKTARKHLLIASVLVQELFSLAHMKIAHDPLTDSEKIAIKAELEKIKFTKLAEFKALISQGDAGIVEAQLLMTDERALIKSFVQAIRDRSFDLPEVVGNAQQLLPVVDRLSYDFSGNNPNFAFLANEYCSSLVLQHQTKSTLLKQALGKDVSAFSESADERQRLPLPETAPVPRPQLPTQSRPASKTTALSHVVEEYLDDQRGRGINEKTIQEYRGVLGKLVEFLDDGPIEGIRRKDLMNFREMLKRYPARPTQQQRSLGLEALLKLDLEEKLGVSSIRKHLDRVSQFMTWAERSGYDVKASIAQGLQPKLTLKESEERDRYTPEELKQIFSTPEYLGEESFYRTAYYWVPLIALFSGMRLDEICQLRTKDIYQDEASKIFVLDCNDEDDDRKLKNKSSPRIIPLHSKLIELGLLEYVDFVRSKKHRMLFPTLTRHPNNGYSHAVSKWYSRYKQALGFGSKKVFHSFRHTVSDTFKQALQNAAVVDAILGHASNGSENHRRYGKDYQLEVMRPVIESLVFDIPAKPFKQVSFIDAEKDALRSPTKADALKAARRSPRANLPELKN